MILLRPYWLLALVPVLLAAALALRRGGAGGWQAVIAPEVLARLRDLGMTAAGGARWPLALPFVAAALVTLGLSGPARPREGGTAFVERNPVVLMLDLSPSVAGSARLADLQAAAALVLANAGGRPVGVMVYAGDAFTASAPTADPAALQGTIAVLAADTMPVAGSRPDLALGSARQLFPQAEGGGDFILISDGGGIGPRATEEAARLHASGARLWTLALTAPAPDAPPTDAEALARLARAGGGDTAPATAPRPLLDRMAREQQSALARSDIAPLVFQDMGRWFVLAALLPALLMFRRQG